MLLQRVNDTRFSLFLQMIASANREKIFDRYFMLPHLQNDYYLDPNKKKSKMFEHDFLFD